MRHCNHGNSDVTILVTLTKGISLALKEDAGQRRAIHLKKAPKDQQVRLKHLLIPHGEHLKVPPSLPELRLQRASAQIRSRPSSTDAAVSHHLDIISGEGRAGRCFQPVSTNSSSTCDPAGGSSGTVCPHLPPLWFQSLLNFDSSGCQRLIPGSSR